MSKEIMELQNGLTIGYLNKIFYYSDGALFKLSTNEPAACVNTKGRKIVRVGGNNYFEHRIIFFMFNGYLTKYIDHEDRNPQNNNIDNLRSCTAVQNNSNRTKAIVKNMTSVYKGVHKLIRSNRFHATIWHNNVRHKLGSFPNQELAALAYNKASVRLNKEFAYINIIQPVR